MGAEYWRKFKLKKDPAGAARFQEGIDRATARHELVDVIKSRRREADQDAPLRYEKTTVKLAFPSTEPANALRRTYYCGRSWVSSCFSSAPRHCVFA